MRLIDAAVESWRGALLLTGLLVALLFSIGARAATGTIVVLDENDSDYGYSDRDYTNGLYGSWTSVNSLGPGDPYRGIAESVTLHSDDRSAGFRHGYFVGQSMFTPENLGLAKPDPNDHPYGGWLFFGVRAYRTTADTLDRAQLEIGIVGPASGAENVQKAYHALIGAQHPNGWSAQLHNEPGIVLTEQRMWRVPLAHGHGFAGAEVIPQANISVGNVFTYAGVGATLRLGQSLCADWGPPRIEPAAVGSDFVDYDALGSFGWYVFVGFEGRAIARNLFLDGNSFESSAHVSKRRFVGDLNAGVALRWQGVGIYGSITERTREFPAQRSDDQFLSIALSFARS